LNPLKNNPKNNRNNKIRKTKRSLRLFRKDREWVYPNNSCENSRKS